MMRKLRTFTAVSIATLVTGGMLPLAAGQAHAAELTDVITDVSLRQEAGTQWDSYDLDITWQMTGVRNEGDTFRVALPDEVRAASGQVVNLKDHTGRTLAIARVRGHEIEFTVTAEGSQVTGLTGRASFGVGMFADLPAGTSLNLQFTSGGKTFTDTFRWTGTQDEASSGWIKWGNPGSEEDGKIHWGVRAPLSPVLADYVLTDTAPADGSWEFDCSSINVWGRKGQANPKWLAGGIYPDHPSGLLADITCSPVSLRVAFSYKNWMVVPGEGPRQVEFQFFTKKLKKLERYENTAKVTSTLGDDVTVSASVAYPRGSGSAEGAGPVTPPVVVAPPAPAPSPEPSPEPSPVPPPDKTNPAPDGKESDVKVTPRPVAKTRKVTKTFQVDRYMPSTRREASIVSGLARDGVLRFREDRALWRRSQHQIVTVTVAIPASQKEPTPAQWIKAINAATSRAVGDVNTTRRPGKVKARHNLVVAWELGRGATARAPWGRDGKVVQKFFARG